MMRLVGWVIVGLLALSIPAGAESTRRHQLKLGGQQDENDNWTKIDTRLGVASGFEYFCGPLASTNTLYNGPALGAEAAIGGTVCETLESGTEGTAAAAISSMALIVTGMDCKVSSAGSNGVVLTLRSASADTSPVMTCTVATGATRCSTVGDVPIAASATMDVKSVTTENLSSADVLCKVYYRAK